ncbi:HopJ type III effector protein [Salinimonas lutimaris]|uniref:HopJ type III effector protein n=1 Tax=Salinimonas lutimaris TaxID=914153 RepID=UPI0010BFB142|nr:HopJ type III effector protein [Salinimonas lutimaris]
MRYRDTTELLEDIKSNSQNIEFNDVIALIDTQFLFTPTRFTNGSVINDADQNHGSCKLLALGRHLALDKSQTLALFGRFYTRDVLENPQGNDHANIRNFMVGGHDGVTFDTFPLHVRSTDTK